MNEEVGPDVKVRQALVFILLLASMWLTDSLKKNNQGSCSRGGRYRENEGQGCCLSASEILLEKKIHDNIVFFYNI